MKAIAENRKARFDYFLLDKFEAGIVLSGGEVKSIRAGNISLAESFVLIRNEECFLKNAHIPQYKNDTNKEYDERADRKLLLKKAQIIKLKKHKEQKGHTIIATKVYLNSRGLIKVEIAAAQGKQNYDKRQTIKERDIKRQLND